MQYPNMRHELLDHLLTLGDRELQQERWGSKKLPPGIELDDLDCVVHFLFDDTPLAEDARRAVGAFLNNDTEAMAVSEVIRALERVFELYGTEMTDAEYISTPEWAAVVASAQRAYKILKDSD